ncbi:S8 family serine peptidase [Microbacterium sp. LRZ72]|uniref:S8 family serine peptidase n=1 Tax=Microbacterium sp. LRZ72 TaxID=2942481 RepID=UPI0029A43D61|nr:S8 family serine peptidase [Microbacterium sp. LRZ72]MDX2377982.1 S8 family serine peptidase [Microbacterium sp. LRZ72]
MRIGVTVVTAGIVGGLGLTGVPQAAVAACAPAPASAVVDALDIGALHDDGLTGEGLTIGVISTSYDNADSPAATSAADDVASGALPGAANPCGWEQPVRVLHDDAPSDDEGRAMLQIVHAIAPAADLVFTTASSAEAHGGASEDASMAAAIDDMIAADVDIIVDDILLITDTAYSPGLAAAAAERAVDAGIVYTVAAGNLNFVGASSIDGVPQASDDALIASWQTTEFRAAACPPAVDAAMAPATVECLDFDPGADEDPTSGYRLYGEPGMDLQTRAVLQWSDPPYAVESQLTGFFLDDDGAVTDVVENMLLVEDLPVALGEVFGGLPDEQPIDRYLVIAREGPALTEPLAVRFAFWDNSVPRPVQAAEYFTSTATDTVGPTLIGRAANPSAVTVAAAPLADPTQLESFSSTGPQVRYYAPAPAGVVPARLAEPEVRVGPTVTGLDGIPTTFFGEDVDGTWMYYGTSAATPVVGAVLALGLQTAPQTELTDLVAALTASAQPLSSPWRGASAAETAGAGLVDPVAFVGRLAPGPAPAPTPSVSPSSAASGAGSGALAASGSTVPALGAGLAGLLVAAGVAAVLHTRRSASTRER